MLPLPVFDDQTQFFVIRIYRKLSAPTGVVRVAKKKIEAVLPF